MEKQVKKQHNWIKVYTVQIDFTHSTNTRWYSEKKGQFFNCILLSKVAKAVYPLPVFCVVDLRGDEYAVPSIIRTIRPEECKVVHETVIDLSGTIRSFIENFSINENYGKANRPIERGSRQGIMESGS